MQAAAILEDLLTPVSDNPFAKREEFSNSNLIAYKILTIVTWLLVFITGAYYTFNAPTDCHRHHHICHSIWGQNNHRLTPFHLNSVVTSIYWVVILILQAHYVRYLWHSDTSYKNGAANVGSHFILVSKRNVTVLSRADTTIAQRVEFRFPNVLGAWAFLAGRSIDDHQHVQHDHAVLQTLELPTSDSHPYCFSTSCVDICCYLVVWCCSRQFSPPSCQDCG